VLGTAGNLGLEYLRAVRFRLSEQSYTRYAKGTYLQPLRRIRILNCQIVWFIQRRVAGKRAVSENTASYLWPGAPSYPTNFSQR
jgi:hypothetical protein